MRLLGLSGHARRTLEHRLRREAAALVRELLAPQAQTRWMPGTEGGPATIAVLLETRDPKAATRALAEAWAGLGPAARSASMLVVDTRATAAAKLVMRASVPLDPDEWDIPKITAAGLESEPPRGRAEPHITPNPSREPVPSGLSRWVRCLGRGHQRR